MNSILHLNLHREFFTEIAARRKRIEYRARTPYWRKRLDGRRYDAIQFRNGYATRAPVMLVEFLGLRRYGEGRGAYYAIRLGRIIKQELRCREQVFARTLRVGGHADTHEHVFQL